MPEDREPGGVGLPDIQSRTIQAPTEKTGAYRPLLTGQTVCTVRDDKDKRCTGYIKQWFTAPADQANKAAPGNVLFRCQRCWTVYEGPAAQYLYPKVKK